MNGSFKLSANTSILAADRDALSSGIHFLQKEMLRRRQIPLTFGAPGASSVIKLILSKKKDSKDDAYILEITKDRVTIEAGSPSGIFYGIVSLLQISSLAGQEKGAVILPACKVEDYPEYAWRGFMLDESRHFFGTEKVKQLLDWMTFYKLNRFHWHLTDEPGWRIEIKKYPLLTLVGGIGNFLEEHAPAQYYTQEQINEIVSYAAERYIEVIPEIDMPGHATAANRAYPQHSGGGTGQHPEFTFHPGKESTYQYLSNILKEVNALFPSGLIHLGGDEVSFGNQQWSTFPEVKQLMEKEHLVGLKQVEKYFIKRMSDTLASINTKTLVWDEAAGFNLPKESTIIFWWRQDKPEQLDTAIKNGYQVVICPRLPFYFDFVQDSTHHYGRRWEGNFNTIKTVYSFSLPAVSPKIARGQILGVQANLWAETLENINRLDYLVFPRITALAEVAWNSPNERTDPKGFMNRVEKHLLLFEKASLYFYNPADPGKNPEPVQMKVRKPRFNTEE